MWIFDEFGNRVWVPNTRFTRIMNRVFKNSEDGEGGGGGNESSSRIRRATVRHRRGCARCRFGRMVRLQEGKLMGALTWCVANWRIISFVVLLAGSFVTGWKTGGESVQRQWDVDIHIRTKAVMEQVVANDQLKTKLKEVQNVNTKTIDMLASTVRKLRADNRLRLPAPPCSGGLPDTDATSGSQDAATGNGELFEPVQTGAEHALERFDGAYAEESERADKIIEGCRVLRDWAATLS